MQSSKYRIAQIITFLLLVFLSRSVSANTIEKDYTVNNEQYELLYTAAYIDYDKYEEIRKKKVNSTILALLLGPFGVHRLYLGTEAKVPVLYTLTLGGGFGILPLIDIVSILTTKELSVYENNANIIMWNK